MHRAEHEIGRRAVPGAHLDIHHPHADRGRGRAAERHAVIEQRPDHRRRRQQPEQRPAEPQGDDAEDEDEHRSADTAGRHDDHVDKKATTRRASTPSNSSGLAAGS